MGSEAGQRRKFEDLGVEVMVITGGDGDVGAEPDPDGTGIALGKRYASEGGVVVLVTKPGPARLLCDGVPMSLLAPKATKSGD